MSKKFDLNECKSGRDFKNYVVHNPQAHDMRQTGSHLCVKGTKPGTAVIPVHDGDMPRGTRQSVIRMLIAIGLGLVAFVCLAPAFMH